MEKKFQTLIMLMSVAVLGAFVSVQPVRAFTKSELVSMVSNETKDRIKKAYYDDYDGDGEKEAFIITEHSEDLQTIWFASSKQVKKISSAWISTGKGRGICKVNNKQKLFIAEGSAAGSGSWSYCCYVENGLVKMVKKAGEGLIHKAGKDFIIYPSEFDSMYSDGIFVGHTYKAYYLYWTGNSFKQYKAKKISMGSFKKYSGGAGILKKIKKSGYKVKNIYRRSNGIININVYTKSSGAIMYDNVNLKVTGKKVKLLISYKKGKNIIEKSGYGGIYKSAGRISETRYGEEM